LLYSFLCSYSQDDYAHIVKHSGAKLDSVKKAAVQELELGCAEFDALRGEMLLPFGVTVGALVPSECSVLSSAAKPLFLSFVKIEVDDFFTKIEQRRKAASAAFRIKLQIGGQKRVRRFARSISAPRAASLAASFVRSLSRARALGNDDTQQVKDIRPSPAHWG
jgi:hypothetical protein